MEQTAGARIGAAIGTGIGAIVDGIASIGTELQLDRLAQSAADGAATAGGALKEDWSRWHEAQPITSASVATAAAATAALAAFAGKRGLMVALTGSAIAGTLLLPIFLVELLQAEDALRKRSPSTPRRPVALIPIRSSSASGS